MSDLASGRRLRLSLRSLILFVTLYGSAYGLWYRWEPWVLIRLIGHQSTVWTAEFDDRSQRLSSRAKQRRRLEACG